MFSNSKSRSRFIPALAATVGALALVPAGALASTTWFGSSLNHDPANSGSTCAEDGVMGSSLCTHVGSFYPGFSGRAGSPVNGTIIAFKVRASGPTKMTFRVVEVRHLSSNHHSAQAKTVVKGPTVHVQGPSQTDINNGTDRNETFHVRLKVKKGQEIAIDTTSNTAEYCADGTPGQLLFDPILGLGQNFRHSSGVDGCLMLVQAVVKH